jgi:hypothetical protein
MADDFEAHIDEEILALAEERESWENAECEFDDPDFEE